MWRGIFELWHPSVLAAYFVGIIALAMFGICPSCACISLAGALVFTVVTQGLVPALAKLRWQLPLLVLICLVNPLYSAMGATLLGRVGPLRIYAESLAYGAVMGALLVSVLLWFEAAASVLTDDEVMELGGGLLPATTLAVSMVMRLIPQLVRRAGEARSVMRATIGARSGRRQAMRLLGVLLSWSLEDSVERADSMRARGWGAEGGRSAYRSHVFRGRDAIALTVVVALCVAAAVGVWRTVDGWRFYPRMEGTTSPLELLPYVVLVALPSLVVLVDEIWWKVNR